jgi:hypothetical protein
MMQFLTPLKKKWVGILQNFNLTRYQIFSLWIVAGLGQ